MNNGENNFLYYLFSLLLMDVHLFFSFLLLQTNYRCVRSLLLSGSDSRFKCLNFHIFAIFLFLYRKQFIPNLALCNSIFIFFFAQNIIFKLLHIGISHKRVFCNVSMNLMYARLAVYYIVSCSICFTY